MFCRSSVSTSPGRAKTRFLQALFLFKTTSNIFDHGTGSFASFTQLAHARRQANLSHTSWSFRKIDVGELGGVDDSRCCRGGPSPILFGMIAQPLHESQAGPCGANVRQALSESSSRRSTPHLVGTLLVSLIDYQYACRCPVSDPFHVPLLPRCIPLTTTSKVSDHVQTTVISVISRSRSVEMSASHCLSVNFRWPSLLTGAD